MCNYKRLVFALVCTLFAATTLHAQKLHAKPCTPNDEPKPQTGFFEARKAAKDKERRKAAKDFRDHTRSNCWGTHVKNSKLKFRKP